jgi:biopolymer transport protein ExbD
MAMWTPDETTAEFELTPMIDVVFLLIAFFMTLISFISVELIELELPEAEQATIPEEPGERQYISIDRVGQIYLGAVPASADELTARLRTLRQNYPTLKVFLRADAQTPHRYVNRVMDAVGSAGIYDLIFASSKD